jgi:preprotein translocase subunit SecG
MFTLLTILHVIVAVFLIMVVLLQSGKAGDLASAFGGAGSQTAFGGRTAATLLTKATAVCAVVFMITSLSLAILFFRGSGGTIMGQVPLSEEVAPTEATREPQENVQETAPVEQPDLPPQDQ